MTKNYNSLRSGSNEKTRWRNQFMSAFSFLIAILLSLTTTDGFAQCGTNAPYSQDFSGTTIPTCWAQSSTSGGPWLFGSFSTPDFGSNVAMPDHTTGIVSTPRQYTWVDMSGTDVGVVLEAEAVNVSSLTTPALEFYFVSHNNSGSVTVYNLLYIETWDGVSYNTVDSIQGDFGLAWTPHYVDLSTYKFATDSVKVRFRIESGGAGSDFDNDILLDDVSIIELPTCFNPTSPVASNVTNSAATLSWTPAGSETQWIVEYDTAGFNLGTGNSMVVSADSLVVTGLNSATLYEFYVRALCGPGDSSGWAGPVSWITLPNGANGVTCATGNPFVTFSDDFESNSGWTGIGSFWELGIGGATSSNTGPSAAHSGSPGSYMNFEASNGATGVSYPAVSPPIDLSFGLGTAELSFWMHAYGSAMGTLDVGVSTSPTGPFTNVFTWVGQLQTSSADAWVNVGVDLTAYVGQTIYIEFLQTDGSSFEGDMSIDLMTVTTCATCLNPSGANTLNIAASSATGVFSSNNTGNSYETEYGIAGFAQGSGTFASVTDTFFNMSSLAPGTAYEWYSREICGPGDTSGWLGPIAFSTLCPVSGTTLPYIQGFDSPSGTQVGSGLIGCAPGEKWEFRSSGNGQIDYGTNSPVSASGGGAIALSSAGGTPNNNFDVTLDLTAFAANSDLELLFQHWDNADEDNANDRVWIRGSDTSAWIEVFDLDGFASNTWHQVGPLDIDSFLNANGQVVSSSFGVSFGQADNASWPGGDGRAFDNLVVRQTPTCFAPLSLGAINVMATSATLNWIAQGPGTNFQVEYDTAGFVPGTGSLMTATDTFLNVSPLMAATSYDFYVREICAPGDTSFWSGPYNFMTPCVALTAPYSQDFDGVTAPALPACWSSTSGSPTQIQTVTSTDHGAPIPTPPNCLEINDVGGNNILVSPAFSDLPTGSNQVRVKIAYEGGASTFTDTLLFGVMTNPSDPNTFVPLDFVTLGIVGQPFQEFTFLLDNTALIGSSTYFGFRYIINGGGFEYFLDDLFYEAIPSCPPPSGIVLDTATTTTATISWTSNGSGNNWEVEYDVAGFVPGTGMFTTTIDTFATLTGLMSTTAYDVYVREICGPGDTSVWVGPVTINTACGVFSMPYFDGFENPSTYPCWSLEFVSATNVWGIGSGSTGGLITSAIEGASNAVFTSTNPSGGGDVTKLVSPIIDASSFGNNMLSFYYGQEVWFGDQNFLAVYYRDSPVDPWIFVWSDSTDQPAWIDTTLSIASSSPTLQIAFEGTDNWGRANVVDSVSLTGTILPPGNDNVCNSFELNIGDTATFDNTAGTVETNEPIGSCWTDDPSGTAGTLENTVWFYFVASADGAYFVSTNFPPTPNNDTQIAAYLATNGCGDFSQFTEIGCGEDIDATNWLSEMTTSAVNAGDTVYVQVDGWAGTVGEFDISVSYIAPVVAGYTYNVVTGTTVAFSDTSLGNPTSWFWDFDDGNTATTATPLNTFVTGNCYDVKLVVSNNSGSDSVTQQICFVGLNNNLNQNVNVYPNPVNSNLNIEVMNSQVDGFSIIDVLGREILSSDKVIIGNDVIDVSEIAPGNYMLKLRFGEEFAIQRISIQR